MISSSWYHGCFDCGTYMYWLFYLPVCLKQGAIEFAYSQSQNTWGFQTRYYSRSVGIFATMIFATMMVDIRRIIQTHLTDFILLRDNCVRQLS